MEFILIGIISGIVTGLGMGGGSILILVLVSFFTISQHVAQAANLIFFIPTAVVAIYLNMKNKIKHTGPAQRNKGQPPAIKKQNATAGTKDICITNSCA